MTFEGAVPKESTPDENGLRDELISVDPGSRGLLNAVVYLETESSVAKDALVCCNSAGFTMKHARLEAVGGDCDCKVLCVT